MNVVSGLSLVQRHPVHTDQPTFLPDLFWQFLTSTLRRSFVFLFFITCCTSLRALHMVGFPWRHVGWVSGHRFLFFTLTLSRFLFFILTLPLTYWHNGPSTKHPSSGLLTPNLGRLMSKCCCKFLPLNKVPMKQTKKMETKTEYKFEYNSLNSLILVFFSCHTLTR